MRNLEYACLGFPNNWYKVDDSLMDSKYFKPLMVRDSETKEILIDNRGKSDEDSLSTYDYFNTGVKPDIQFVLDTLNQELNVCQIGLEANLFTQKNIGDSVLDYEVEEERKLREKIKGLEKSIEVIKNLAV
jgi:hypothetical protein